MWIVKNATDRLYKEAKMLVPNARKCEHVGDFDEMIETQTK